MSKAIKVKKAAKKTAKRPYNRKPKLVPVEKVDSPTNKEIELLALIISVFDNWTNEQKQRNLKYLASRYYDFL